MSGSAAEWVRPRALRDISICHARVTRQLSSTISSSAATDRLGTRWLYQRGVYLWKFQGKAELMLDSFKSVILCARRETRTLFDTLQALLRVGDVRKLEKDVLEVYVAMIHYQYGGY